MYYVEVNNKIILFDTVREKIENTLRCMPQYQGVEIQETDRPIVDFEFADTPEWEEKQAQKEHARIMELKMTPLDFLKAIGKLGVTYATVKQIMDENPEVDMEMRFCQNVYRKHPMIEQFATQFGITSEQLDNIFKEANGEEV